MKIADVKIQVIKRDIPVPSGIGLRHEGISFMESLAEVPVVRILTDEGIPEKDLVVSRAVRKAVGQQSSWKYLRISSVLLHAARWGATEMLALT